jgi:hypothetical protein
MPSLRKSELVYRALRWLCPAALLALAPKCLLCVLAYAGLGAAFKLGGREICGAPNESPLSWPAIVTWLGVAVFISSVFVLVGHPNKRR